MSRQNSYATSWPQADGGTHPAVSRLTNQVQRYALSWLLGPSTARTKRRPTPIGPSSSYRTARRAPIILHKTVSDGVFHTRTRRSQANHPGAQRNARSQTMGAWLCHRPSRLCALAFRFGASCSYLAKVKRNWPHVLEAARNLALRARGLRCSSSALGRTGLGVKTV